MKSWKKEKSREYSPHIRCLKKSIYFKMASPLSLNIVNFILKIMFRNTFMRLNKIHLKSVFLIIYKDPIEIYIYNWQ